MLSNITIAGNTSNSNELTLAVNHFAILPQNLATQLRQQCSRDTPQIDFFWMSEHVQIIQFKKQIIDFIIQIEKYLYNIPTPQAYDRQCIGII